MYINMKIGNNHYEKTLKEYMMIKGVNKKVLEINNPQSLYFEKAVLYIKPNMTNVSYKLMRAEAQEMLKKVSPQKRKYDLLCKSVPLISAFIMGFGGALVAYLILFG